MNQALRAAHMAPHRPDTEGLRAHFVSSKWSAIDGIIELPRLLRSIEIELIEDAEGAQPSD
jgi:hypothetical protein